MIESSKEASDQSNDGKGHPGCPNVTGNLCNPQWKKACQAAKYACTAGSPKWSWSSFSRSLAWSCRTIYLMMRLCQPCPSTQRLSWSWGMLGSRGAGVCWSAASAVSDGTRTRQKSLYDTLYQAVNRAGAMPCTSNSASVKLPDLTSCGQVTTYFACLAIGADLWIDQQQELRRQSDWFLSFLHGILDTIGIYWTLTCQTHIAEIQVILRLAVWTQSIWGFDPSLSNLSSMVGMVTEAQRKSKKYRNEVS